MWNKWWIWLLADLAAGMILALALRFFLCVLCRVKGRSMMDALQDGEVVFALRRKLCRLKRFDVVLCRYPGRKGLFVKRIIGLPGERIAMEDGVLRIDGEAMAEDLPLRPTKRSFEERQIGPGEYFLMGDNRPASHDSRSARVGMIAEGEILAVVKCVVLPPWRARRI